MVLLVGASHLTKLKEMSQTSMRYVGPWDKENICHSLRNIME